MYISWYILEILFARSLLVLFVLIQVVFDCSDNIQFAKDRFFSTISSLQLSLQSCQITNKYRLLNRIWLYRCNNFHMFQRSVNVTPVGFKIPVNM